MSRFTVHPIGAPYDPSKVYFRMGFKYQLSHDLVIQTKIYPKQDIVTEYITLLVSGKLTLRHGYASDGPSGPTFDTPKFMRGAWMHDALYQLERMQYLPEGTWKLSDKELVRICKEDGMWWPRRTWVLAGLTLANGAAAFIGNVKLEMEAP